MKLKKKIMSAQVLNQKVSLRKKKKYLRLT